MPKLLLLAVAGLAGSISIRNVTDGVGQTASSAGPILVAVSSVAVLGGVTAYVLANKA